MKITKIEKDWKEEYDYIYDYKNGLYKVRKGKKYGIINDKNEIVLPIEYDSMLRITGKTAEATKGDDKFLIEF